MIASILVISLVLSYVLYRLTTSNLPMAWRGEKPEYEWDNLSARAKKSVEKALDE